MAGVVVTILRLQGGLGRLYQQAQLHVFAAHDLCRAGQHAGLLFKRRKKHLLFGAKMLQHQGLKACEGRLRFGPTTGSGMAFGLGKKSVAKTMIAGHEVLNGGHGVSHG